jgi:hypothetical protein
MQSRVEAVVESLSPLRGRNISLPMTYLEAMNALQQRGFDALKVAGSTQIHSLRTALDCAAALTETSRSFVPPNVSEVAALVTTFTFQILEQQVSYAKQITDTLAGPARTPPPVLAAPAVAVLPMLVAAEIPPALVAAEIPPALVAAEIPPALVAAEIPPALVAAEIPPALVAAEIPPAIVYTSAPAVVEEAPPTIADAAGPQPAPEAALEAQVDPQPTVPSVSGEVSVTTAPTAFSQNLKAKNIPNSSARANAKPPKAQRHPKRGPGSK